MKKSIIALIIALSIFISCISILVFSFNQGVKPDKDEEEKIRILAEQYLEEEFNDNFEIFDVLYDNMGNYFYFDYAAKIRDKKSDIKFLVYYNDESKQELAIN